jgi:ribosomal protein L24E
MQNIFVHKGRELKSARPKASIVTFVDSECEKTVREIKSPRKLKINTQERDFK